MFSVLIGIRALQASFTRYVVTDLRVLRVSGVLNRRGRVHSLGQGDRHHPAGIAAAVDRPYRGTICIESANERSGFRSIDDVDDPDEFYRTVVRMVDLKQGRLSDNLD